MGYRQSGCCYALGRDSVSQADNIRRRNQMLSVGDRVGRGGGVRPWAAVLKARDAIEGLMGLGGGYVFLEGLIVVGVDIHEGYADFVAFLVRQFAAPGHP